MKKMIRLVLWPVTGLLCVALLLSACKKTSTPDPDPEDERITLVKKWVSKWSFLDMTKVEPKIEYFNISRNAQEMISGEKEFTLQKAKTLDTLTLLFAAPPVRPPAGEVPNLSGFYFLKQYPDFSADRLNLEMTPATDGKTKGTIVVRQTLAGPFVAEGQANVWRITFTVPK